MTPADGPDSPPADLPREPIHRLVSPVVSFLHVSAAGGAVLFVSTVLALVLANSPVGEVFLGFWQVHVSVAVGDFVLDHSLKHWINDGLMGLFFFVVGLEVKREMALGELRDPRRAALPVAAALGGMVVPAAIYLVLQAGTPTVRGWGIPMATDIAFAVGCLALLGDRVPGSLRVLLLSLAIVDDIGAILVIAIGYTRHVDTAWLCFGFAGIGLVLALQRLGVRSTLVYVVVGILAWLGFEKSGVHATIAGVILGLLTPARSWVSVGRLEGIVRRAEDALLGRWDESGARYRELRRVEAAVRESVSPLERLEKGLHPWSSFVIMPIFALANAGVAIHWSAFGDPVAVAVGAGLVVGKPLGILAFAWVAVRLGLARLPDGVGWGAVGAVGALAGIGFTMSLFIAGLALSGEALDAAKIGILAGSVVSGVVGMALLVVVLPRRASSR